MTSPCDPGRHACLSIAPSAAGDTPRLSSAPTQVRSDERWRPIMRWSSTMRLHNRPETRIGLQAPLSGPMSAGVLVVPHLLRYVIDATGKGARRIASARFGSGIDTSRCRHSRRRPQRCSRVYRGGFGPILDRTVPVQLTLSSDCAGCAGFQPVMCWPCSATQRPPGRARRVTMVTATATTALGGSASSRCRAGWCGQYRRALLNGDDVTGVTRTGTP